MRIENFILPGKISLLNNRQNFLRIVSLIFAVICFNSLQSQIKVESFRYELTTRSGDPYYSTKISNGINNGLRYEVEMDELDRIKRVSEIRDGKNNYETQYTFSGNNKLPTGLKTYRAGELTRLTEIQRNDKGERIRLDAFTAQGAATVYALYNYTADFVEFTTYSPEGKKKAFFHHYYSAKGLRIRSLNYPDATELNTYYDSEIDENTGLQKTRKKITNNVLVVLIKYTYDADGDLTREDLYDNQSNWYGMFEYDQGLLVKKMYKQVRDTTLEIRITYNEKRFANESKLYYNNNLICRFTYDRFQDGITKRTLASGPNGELWAEYPDMYVNEVQRNGQALDKPGAIIYKKGNWW